MAIPWDKIPYVGIGENMMAEHQCNTCYWWNGPIEENIDHSHCTHPMRDYKTLPKDGSSKACHYYDEEQLKWSCGSVGRAVDL